MQSQKLVSFFRIYLIMVKNAVVKARVIFRIYLIQSQIYELIFIDSRKTVIS